MGPDSRLVKKDKECLPRGQKETHEYGSTFSILISVSCNNNKRKGMSIERENIKMYICIYVKYKIEPRHRT